MSRSKRHLRAVNADDVPVSEKIPWKTIAMTSAIGSIAAFGAVELVKFLLSKAQDARTGKKAEDEAKQAQAAALANPMGGANMQALPGAVQPNLFQSPYSQMQMMQRGGMMPGGGMPGMPQGFTNPMVMPMEGDDEPPKWFREFRSEHDKRLQQMEARFSPSPSPQAQAPERNLSAVEEDADYYEDDEAVA